MGEPAPNYPRGRFLTHRQWSVVCVTCGTYGDWYQDANTRTARDAERVFRDGGWRRWGGWWICPNCLKEAVEVKA